jgi:hypothetical protein
MAGMAAAGAAAGTAIMPGIGTAIGAVGGLLLDSFMGGGESTAAQGPAGTSSAAVAVYGSGLNADNWNVNFKGSQTNTSTANKRLDATGPTANTAGQGGAILPPAAIRSAEGEGGGLGLGLGGSYYGVPVWAWAGMIGLVAWKASKSGK